MKDVEDLSQAKMVLLAIYRVSMNTGDRVAFEELVIQAWKDFPEQFSLRNHPEYPDSYRIYNRIYTTLIAERFLVSLRKQVYRLTDKGLNLAKELDSSGVAVSIQNDVVDSIKFSREEDDFLQNVVRSRLFTTWKKKKEKELIDYDVRMFFQFSTGTPVRERNRKIENARDAIEKALKNGMGDAKNIKELFDLLITKFSRMFEET